MLYSVHRYVTCLGNHLSYFQMVEGVSSGINSLFSVVSSSLMPLPLSDFYFVLLLLAVLVGS